MGAAVQAECERDRSLLADRYQAVRAFTEALCETLTPEDCGIQSMPEASPIRWHLAHTTWFFDTFVLTDVAAAPRPAEYRYLFNSYYNAVGEQFPRARRGMISRPGTAEVMAYRREVDEQMDRLFHGGERLADDVAERIELGIQHEQQHQELMLTDIKHAFWRNPMLPAYRAGELLQSVERTNTTSKFEAGVYEIGHSGSDFSYDNERPRHRVYLEAFQIADRLVTCGDFLDFIEDGGYRRPEVWLSQGWDEARKQGWQAPLYWRQEDGRWQEFTLAGLQAVERNRPVCHVSYFEADAFARWRGARLPTEAEWEVASARYPAGALWSDDLFSSGAVIHPAALMHPAPPGEDGTHDYFGVAWQWTASPYVAYPGYRPGDGALAEYNGKFMCNQFVLRGGSCATPANHVRRSYRNFFPPEARWQFSGLRLAK